MRDISNFLPIGHRTRSVLFVLVSLVIWTNFSLPQLISGNGEMFQRAGSLIVVWSIFFYARGRLKREKYLEQIKHDVIVTQINRLDAHRRRNDYRLGLTFDTYMLQIAKMSLKIGIPNPIGPETQQDIAILARQIDEETGGETHMPPLEEDRKADAALKAFNEFEAEQSPWISLLARIEVFFAILGTLQWGYGDLFVDIVHEAIEVWS